MADRRGAVRVAVLLAIWFAPAAVLAGAGTPVAGTVHTADRTPIAGARVVVHEAQRDDEATTDAKGQFTIPDVTLPAAIDVTAAGFAPFHGTVTAAAIDVALDPAGMAESVVVTADRAPAWRDPASGATVLDQTNLQKVPAVTLDESLRIVSGFSLYRRSSSVYANPTTDGVTMRGLSASGASRGLILLDGIPLNDGFGGWVTWTRLPAEAVDQVDVDRGAVGDVFGSDALGGVVRIITPTVMQPEAVVSGEFGSEGVRNLDLAGGERHGRVSLFGATNAFHTDGTILVPPGERGPIDIPADATWYNGFGRADVNLGPGQRLTVEGWGGQDSRDNGTPIQVNRMTGGTGAVIFADVSGTTTFTVRASFTPNSFYQTFSTVNAARTSETLTATQNTRIDTGRAVVELGRTFSRFQVMARGNVNRASGTFENVTPSASSTDSLDDTDEAVSGEAVWTPAGSLTLDAGARREWRAAPTSDSAQEAATVGHAGLVWQIAPTVSIRSTAATSHRWPTLNELVRNFQMGNILTLANPDLVAEEATSQDAALFVTHPHWLVSIGGFHTDLNNAVLNVTQPAGTVPGFSGIVRKRENAGLARVHGAELDGELRPVRPVRFRGSLTALGTELADSPEADLDGLQLPDVPRVSASLSGDATVHRITASAVWHAVSSQWDDDRNTLLLAPGYQLDVRVAGHLGPTEWNVVLENALNNEIETSRTSATLVTVAPGRALRVGLTWRK